MNAATQPYLDFKDQVWIEVRDGNLSGYAMHQRHYSATRYRRQRQRLFVGPGFKLVLLTPDAAAVFAWRKFIDGGGQQGINCAIFRNEGSARSSDLIRTADESAWQRWPDEPRHYTYVDPRKVRSNNPGYCFLMAGWRKCGRTKGGLLILEIIRQQPCPEAL